MRSILPPRTLAMSYAPGTRQVQRPPASRKALAGAVACSAALWLLAGPSAGEPPPGPVAATPAPAASSAPLTPKELRRPEEQTFLTWPEWYLVYSPDEYARFVTHDDPSGYPFIGDLRQFTQCYRAAWEQTRGRYPLNLDYHVMCAIIGVSTAAEYGTRSVYEGVAGRLSSLLMRHGPTPEDRYGAEVAARYASFLDTHAWYEFDYFGALGGLWKRTPWLGSDLLRKVERRYALTSEYIFKGVYGWAMNAAARTSYTPEKPVTAIVVDQLPAPLPPELSTLQIVQTYADGKVLALAPRYTAFGKLAVELARHGVRFVEIAGNRGLITLSVRAPRYSLSTRPSPEIVLTQEIQTQAAQERAFLAVPVSELSTTLLRLRRSDARLEHVYDY